jgi:Domain of unknown function (DUF4873)
VSERGQPDGYEGEVTVVVEGEEPRTAHAALAARFDPLAGHVVWTGRVSAGLPPRTPLVLRTLHGSGSAEVVERVSAAQPPGPPRGRRRSCARTC